jgi:hypothetical protein
VETLGAARLTKEIPAQRAVATIVPREEITAVLQDPDADPELYLRITGEAGDGDVIGMSWSRAELEQLLERATGDRIVLTFDRDELAGALGDVEAHGMRERALVFAVAAAGALGTGVTIANAMPAGGEGGPVVTSVAPADTRVTDASSAAGYTVAATSGTDSIVSDAASGAGYAAPAAAADEMLTDASSAAGYAAAATSGTDSIVSDAASGAGYTAPVAAEDAMLTDASSAAGYAAAADASSTDAIISDAASAAGYAAPTPQAADSMRTDASLSGGYGPAETTGSGSLFSVHSPSTTDGLLAGGVLLAIAGATFASRRSSGTVRPA